jgi:predicted metalloendopeptidase
VNYDIAKNYGGIGCIIGHELSHGFDDMGCNFDGYGKLHNWWTDEDLKKYKNKIMVLKDQFDNFEFEGTKVNGELTLGENIADLCGVLIALSGLKNKLDQNISNVMLKKFFISYAEIWRCKLRPESIKTQLLTDPHSLPEFRVNGILNNVDDFYKVFDVKDNSLLYLEPNKRARIW